jgi:tetratricopeptide (TPR) repeat protein
MAIHYYESNDNVPKLAMIFLETGDKKKLIGLKSSATTSEATEIKKIEDHYLERQKINKYIETAERYVKEERYQEAEIYYHRILKKKLSYGMRNDIYYKLVDTYYKLEEFKLGEQYLNKIDPKALISDYLGDYYYLGGMIYYNLKEYDKSTRYFKDLSKNFPDTPLSNRGRIYLLKIKKIQK